MNRGTKDFLGKPAPPGYVAGIGRGVTGFMTRPDLGSGKDVALNPDSRFSSDRSGVILREEDEERWSRVENEEGLLAPSTGGYNAEDEEADSIFSAVEAKMAERRQRHRHQAAMAEAAKAKLQAPTIQTLFADAKRGLSTVSLDEWAALPESLDFSAKRVKKSNEKERYMPLPDDLIVSGVRSGGFSLALPADLDETSEIGRVRSAREQVLGINIDQTQSSTLGGQAVDPEEYLQQMSAQQKQSMQVGDVKKARQMLSSAVQTNPTSSQAWISLVRLEEVALDLKKARELILEACDKCPDAEDVWLEAIRLLPKEQMLATLTRALDSLPTSGKLWIKLADLEIADPLKKQKILQRGLERSPASADLWKALVELEEDENDAKALLEKAVDCCPKEIDLALALARLQSHEEARATLNRARQATPESPEIWLAAARLEEAYENVGLVEKIVRRAWDHLKPAKSDWIRWAADCEETEDTHTAIAMISILEYDDIDSILSDAKEAMQHRLIAKTLVERAIDLDPTQQSVWLRAIELVPDEEDLLERAVKACPTSESLWLVLLKSKADLAEGVAVLSRAYELVPGSEILWLSAAKMQLAAGHLEQAKATLQQARTSVASEKIWRKSAQLAMGPEAKQLLVEGLQRFPASAKMWIALASLESGPTARGIFTQALTACPQAEDLWIAAARFEESLGDESRARALLEKARLKLPKAPKVWLDSVRLEVRAGQSAMAKSLLNRALQACPCGLLWAEAVSMEPKPLRKSKAMAALQQLGGEDSLILTASARIAWSERKLEAAKDYFARAITADSNDGDIWAAYIRFAQQHLSSDETANILNAALLSTPKEGEQWRTFRKARRLEYEQDPRALFYQFLSEVSCSY